MADELRDPVWKLVNAYGGGLLVVVPGLALVAAGVPLWVTLTYLCAVVVVLTAVVIRRRREKGA